MTAREFGPFCLDFPLRRAAAIVIVFAKSSYLGTFNMLYGTYGKTCDTCTTCHGARYSFNTYGADVKSKKSQLGDLTAALRAVETWDSDGDGDSNIVEIGAGTFPGNALSSLPVEESSWGKIKSLFQ
jgi:hypothetical protein